MKVERPISRTAALGIVALLATSAIKADSESIIVSGFQTPESVVHDLITDLYLVSNVGPGDVTALDHNGFISRVSPQGVILQLKWIQDGVNGVTLNGPKGIWLDGNALYVADIDTLRIFDRFTGAPLRNIAIPNSLFLNDVVVAPNGTTYVTDTLGNAIFTIDPAGHVSSLVGGAQTGLPNGIQVQGGNITWVTFFGHQVLLTNSSGKIFVEATLPSPDVSQLGFPPGSLLLDGYVRLPDNSLLVTSWVTGKVYRISPSRRNIDTVAQFASLLANPATADGPADISVDLTRNRLLVPLFNTDKLVILPLQD